MIGTGGKIALGLLAAVAVGGIVYEVKKPAAAATSAAAAPIPSGQGATLALSTNAASYPQQSISKAGGVLTITAPAGASIQSVTPQGNAQTITTTSLPPAPAGQQPTSAMVNAAGTPGSGSVVVQWSDSSGNLYMTTIPIVVN